MDVDKKFSLFLTLIREYWIMMLRDIRIVYEGISMNRSIMQNFFRIILMIGVLFSFSAQWSIAAEEIHSVNPEVIKSKLSEVETRNLDEASKKKLTELYNLALANIEKTRSYTLDTESFVQIRKTAPEEIEKLNNILKQKEEVSPEKILEDLEMKTQQELVDEIEKEKADLSAVEARLSDFNNRLVTQSTRPNSAKERLIELKSSLDAITIPQKSSEDAVSVMIQAENWVQETKSIALSSEIKMLDQELLSYQIRINILKAKRDVEESKVKYITTRIDIMDELLNKRRLEEVNLVQQQVETTQKESKNKHPLIRKLADQNVVLGKKLKASTLNLDDISNKDEHNRESVKRIKEYLNNIKQKLNIAGMNQEYGEILMKQHSTIPKISVIQSEMSRLKKSISNSRLDQIQYAEEYKQLRDIDTYLKNFMKDIPQIEADAIRTELKELALSRQTLLNQLIELESSYSRGLEEHEISLQKLIDGVKEYNQFLSENLVWIRSTKPVSLSLFKSLPEELERLLSPSNWIHVGDILIAQITSKFSISILIFALIFLIFMRGRFLKAAVGTNKKIKSIRTDHFGYTLEALFWMALASLPLSLLLMITGWQLSLAAEPTEFSNAVSGAIVRTSIDFFYLLFFADLAMPNGLLVKHFRWSDKIASRLHNEIRLLLFLILPALFVTIYSVNLESVGISGVLTRLGLLSIIGAIGLFIFRTFTPMGGVLAEYFKTNTDHYIVRYRFIWEKFFVALIVAIVILLLLGYLHTASILTLNLFITIWMIYTFVLIRGLIARWLLLVNRRLEVQAILARREEARIAKEAIEKTGANNLAHNEPIPEYDEPEVDLVDLGIKSRKLLQTILFSGAIVGLWFIWSPLLPAFNFLNDISLWSSKVMVNGVDIVVPITLGNLIFAIVVIFITIIASRGLPALLEFILLQNENTTLGGRYTATTLFRYVIVAIGTLSFFNIIGASWSQIQWLAAALSVGIGFGLQEIVANFISGLIILFERPIRVGDTVTVGTTTGTVTRIQIRATTITTWDRQELLVPNKEFITTQLLNWTLSDQTVRVVIPVGIAYGSDVAKAMKLLKESATEHEGVLRSPESFVAFESFGDNALQLTLRVYLPSLERRIETTTEINESINRKLNEAGISIAFPQRDIHFDTSKPIDIRLQHEKDNVE